MSAPNLSQHRDVSGNNFILILFAKSSKIFLEQYQKLAQEEYGDDTIKYIGTSFYAKLPSIIKRVLNQARLETESYDTMIQHLKRDVELNGLSAPIETNITGVHQIDVPDP